MRYLRCTLVVFMAVHSATTAAGPAPSAQTLVSLSDELRARPATALPRARESFAQWCSTEASNGALQEFRQRLAAVQSLREQIIGQLGPVGKTAIDTLAEDLISGQSDKKQGFDRKKDPARIVPAEQVYSSFLPHFTHRIETGGFTPEQQIFLRAYYSAEVYATNGEIMSLARSLASASEDLHLESYLLLLPLLHSPRGFNPDLLKGLPPWTLTSTRLNYLIEFCLVKIGRLDAAETVGALLAHVPGAKFSHAEFYTAAAATCVAHRRPDRAVECLNLYIENLKGDESKICELRFRICEIWTAAKNHGLAANEAGRIVKEFPNTPVASKALFLRVKAFSDLGDAPAVLREVDDALADAYSDQYRPDLLCYKWQAMRREGKGDGASKVLKTFLAEYPTHPHGAEMHYAVAIDCLSAQRYDASRDVLEALISKYPQSEEAKKAQDLLKKLTSVETSTVSASRPG